MSFCCDELPERPATLKAAYEHSVVGSLSQLPAWQPRSSASPSRPSAIVPAYAPHRAHDILDDVGTGERRRSSFGNPSRVTVSISSMPSRIEPATPDALAAQFRPCRRGSRSYWSFSPSGARCRGHCLRIPIHHLAKGPHAGSHTSLRTCNEHYGIEPLIAAIRASCFAEIASSISKRVSYGQTPKAKLRVRSRRA